MRKTTARGFILVAAAAALWGSDGLLRRTLAFELPAAAVVFAEHLILVVITLPLLLRAGPALRSFTPKDWTVLVGIGAGASAAATVLFTQAFTYGNPNTPLLLQKLQPLFAVAGARLMLGERQLPRFGLYLVAGLSGAYLVAFPDPGAAGVAGLEPALLASGAALLWGFGTVLGRYLSATVEFRQLTALRFAIGLPFAGVIMLVQGEAGALMGARPRDGAALFLLALIPGLVALLLYYRGLRETPASAATLAELAFPVSAVTLNYFVFGATLTGSQWLGLAILSGTILAMTFASARGSSALGIELTVGEEPLPSRT